MKRTLNPGGRRVEATEVTPLLVRPSSATRPTARPWSGQHPIGRPWLLRLPAATLLAVAALGGPAGSPASAAAACGFDAGAGAVSVTLDGSPAVLTRGAGPTGAITLDGTPCGTATVALADTVTVTGSAGDDDLTLDLTQGALAPGRTVEAGVSAIETTLDLAGGDDTLRVVLGPGADRLDGCADGFDLVSADHQDLVLTGHGAGAGAEHLALDLGAGDDHATLSAGTPLAVPAAIQPGPGADDVTGGGSDDLLLATPAGASTDSQPDTFHGGAGTDRVDYAARTAGVLVAPDDARTGGQGEEGDVVGADVEDVVTGSGDDLVIGSAAANTISTGAGADAVLPGPGDDVVDLGTGPDRVTADAGPDGSDELTGSADALLDYSARAAGIQVDLAAGEATGPAGEHDLLTGFSQVTGGDGADVLIGSSAADQLDGGPGADRLVGGPGPDTLLGGDGNDRFGQGAAPDGADRIGGGPGLDTVDYSGRSTPVLATLGGLGGAAGEGDLIGDDVEALTGGSAADLLTGNGFSNVLTGNAGNDTLRGRGGNDAESGGPGNDWFRQDAVPNGADRLSGGAGVDLADYLARTAPVAVNLDGQADDGGAGERDSVGSDVENVRGGAGPDRLVGSAGPNRLDGGPGADLLDGLAGPDLLVCGAGFDRAVRRPGDSYPGCETVR
jgi:Ca2+-binding RTX toxin-like protein